jgi:hypothetical protein
MKQVIPVHLIFFAFPFILCASDIDVVFIGISQGSAPAFEETLDRRVRENLSTLKEIALIDYLQTQTFRRKIRFDEFPTVSRKLVETLKQYSSDSAVFVWGSVKNNTFTGMRKNAIREYIRGEMTLTLNIYSLRYKNYAFIGDVQSSFEKPKGFIFFGDAKQDMAVSATDRKEMIDRLLDLAARKSASLIAAVIQSERLHAAKESETAGAKSYEVPSVSDMFNVPSVEAASVEKNRKKNAPAPGPYSPQKAPPPAKDTLSSKKQTSPQATDTLALRKQPPPPSAKPDSVPTAVKAAPLIDTVKEKEKK